MQKTSLWQRLTFSDVSPLISALSTRQAELSDAQTLSFVKERLEDEAAYKNYREALPLLRRSVFLAVPKFEKKSLWFMLLVHITDVHLSIFGALVSVQVLRTFEPAQTGWRLVDSLFNSPSQTQLFVFASILAALIFCVNLLATSLHAQKIESEMLLSYRIRARIDEYLYEHVLRMSRADRIRFQSGDLVNLGQTDARNIAAFYSHAMVDFPVLFVSVTVIMVIMYIMIGKAAWIGLVLVLLQIPISAAFSWFATRMNTEHMKRSDARISLVSEWIQGMRLVRYFGWRRHFEREITEKTRSEFRQDLKLKALYSYGFALSTSWWMVVSVGIFAALLVLEGGKNASQIFSAIWLTTILGHQLTPLPWFVNIYAEARVASKRLARAFGARLQEEEYLEVAPSQEVPQWVKELRHSEAARGQVDVGYKLKNVTVRFSDAPQPVLRNVTFEVAPAKVTAVIGPVGSGKSILLQLLMGEVAPSEGEVLLVLRHRTSGKTCELAVHTAEGVETLRSLQTLVPQEAFIASASVKENVPLRYFETMSAAERARVDDNRIMNALFAAQMESDLKLFPAGLQTELGERGVNLSGGQKQRLSLARSAFSHGRIVFLDDPLSAVDKETEKLLIENLFNAVWKQNAQTVVWATHRLDFLAIASLVVFLENGELKECGTFEELSSNPSSRLTQFVASAQGGKDE